ncbi:putative F-box protein PP2-B12 [Carica papaya]|uniref:putative F-box protein PP2-B12 n=1 Tax=Carica papaya TaxID=3649 RepID=UPI000B8CCE3B|nr:putative F-box protein PP2-B12 [Carica papaya]
MASSRGGGDDGCSGDGEAVVFSALPEGCIANVLSLTTPKDTCRLSLVSKMYQSAAESDTVWERFLPSGYETMIPESLLRRSKKEIYLSLCDNYILIDDGDKSLSLEKRSGKKCYMLSPRSLTIIWGSTPKYWRWGSFPGARFAEVAELLGVCWLEIRGKIKTRLLSPNTMYEIYLVFQLRPDYYGFDISPYFKVGVGVSGGWIQERIAFLDEEHHFGDGCYPNYQIDFDNKMEVELGDYYHVRDGDDDEELEIYVLETTGGHWKCGVVVHGIHIRPRQHPGDSDFAFSDFARGRLVSDYNLKR